MVAIESIVAKAGGRAASYVGQVAVSKLRRKALLDQATALIDRTTFDAFLTSLTAEQGAGFLAFLESPQFEHLALRTTVWHLAGRSEGDLADIRETARLSLRARLDLADEQLLTGVDLVMRLLTVASESAIQAHRTIDNGFAVGVVADLAVAAARQHELLEKLPDLRGVDRFSKTFRAQVGATRAKMRLAHLGRRAGIEYSDLHVDPTFHFPDGNSFAPENRATAETLDQYQRFVVLGDPGAGKSTFAAKLAHDLAVDAVEGMRGRVPFLVVAREHAEQLRTSRRPLVALLEDVAKDPYNIVPPAGAIEYLLLNGSAFVIIDGIDELGDAEARRRLADLVEAFAHHYPLVNIVVTSRSVGYDEAALDQEQFTAVRIAPFTEEQVADYARRWFGLEREQQALAESFLSESADIHDLRSNPLVLSLLCSLYESKHYIPPNRSQIYEKCAELLFEQWDQGRGVSVPMPYGTHMRPAVARLAWQMFTDPSGGQVLAREQVAELLIEYMLEERFDRWSEAADAANQFLDYCAGRAWLLTEMGVRNGQRVYGFTHRTFLEYFTAVHLVRLGPSPAQVWERLSDRIPDASWRNVAHLAVHRLERDADGGASGLMELLLNTAVASPQRPIHLQFAAEVASQIGLRSATLRRIAIECVRLAGELPSRARYRYSWTQIQTDALGDADRALKTLMAVQLPENVARLGSAVADALSGPEFDLADEAISYGLIAVELLETLSLVADVSEFLRRESGLSDFAEVRKWETRVGWASSEDVQTHGASILFKQVAYYYTYTHSGASHILSSVSDDAGPAQSAVSLLEALYRPLVEDPWPWLRAQNDQFTVSWAPSAEAELVFPRLQSEQLLALPPAARSAALLLLLVMMQHTNYDETDLDGPVGPLLKLAAARKTGRGRAAAVKRVETWDLLPEAEALVVSWINDEASPVLRHN
ncbi:NACHT domain-containing protein [Actinoplanes bogorensis]|uniref:NACHT domain-containing protein n=1 Tax=Paractinoplanes bogorensis TaxID=1610840 RepID=A0ABS5YNY0_9ACTN|nr:NACHT domain-containing protein [Actinoplanes bogorensis]MBU2665093.1 NACHT domain-containing protein [Actinoplanes bogorensis]